MLGLYPNKKHFKRLYVKSYGQVLQKYPKVASKRTLLSQIRGLSPQKYQTFLEDSPSQGGYESIEFSKRWMVKKKFLCIFSKLTFGHLYFANVLKIEYRQPLQKWSQFLRICTLQRMQTHSFLREGRGEWVSALQCAYSQESCSLLRWQYLSFSVILIALYSIRKSSRIWLAFFF